MEMSKIPAFPKIIEIQFQNLCNSDCIICPYKDMHYTPCVMDDKMFLEFINQIKDENVEWIIPYLHNEPFIDKDYLNKLRIIKKYCPKSEIEISTNVSLLTKETITELKELSITELRLSVFGFYEKTYKHFMPKLNHKKVFENLEHIANTFKDSSTVVSVIMIDNGEISNEEFEMMAKYCKDKGFCFNRWGFLDRAKNVSNYKNNFFDNKVNFCEQNRPFERMHILANGDVIFCCQDWKHNFVVGNLKNSTIKEIWHGDKYNSLRDSLTDEDKTAPEICCNCKLAHYKEKKWK